MRQEGEAEMGVKLPNGATLEIASEYGSKKTISALTNANPAVATSTAHGLENNDYVEVSSGWGRLNDRIVKVAGADTDTFSMDGYDASNVSSNPAGTGIGSVREITGWTQIPQIVDFSTSGGEMQYTSYSFLESDSESQIPTQNSAKSITIEIADDPLLPCYAVLKEASDTREKRALRLKLPGGSEIVYNGYVSFSDTPTMKKNELMTVTATFSLASQPLRYTA